LPNQTYCGIADSVRQNIITIVALSQLNVQGEKESPNMGLLKGFGGDFNKRMFETPISLE